MLVHAKAVGNLRARYRVHKLPLALKYRFTRARCRVKKLCEQANSCITRSCVIPPLQLRSVLARENET